MKNYDLTILAKKIKEVRKNRKISQLDLSIEANIDRKTISRIENGINEPSFSTLYKISYILNHDFIKDYLHSSLKDYLIFNETFEKIIDKVENKLPFDDEEKIIVYLKDFTDIEFIKTSCKQVILFLKSMNEDLSKSEEREILIKALNSFTNKYDNFKIQSFSIFELRILMDIAMTYTNIDNKKYLELLNFVYDKTNKDSSLFPIISLNLTNAYIILEDYEKCPEIINDAISYFLVRNKIPNPILYFTRSVYKRLKNMDYKEDYDKAILIANLAENYNLINKFEQAKSYYEKYYN
ncbi:MAG: helix-turn-helix transcriptional regulator [Anaerococcus vaginalis]|uniref:helix-turn-helix domain-containing protein n=1 Tax=Anaerococcus vaginalis TaxID=33037 RepID=UPI0028FDC554|nr:helix-turn-helix transcriptional regulator [Anaerococcus vaginalis]MDU1763819.1 helix-turn-helix transcriptional regulator [Anaerococcus vaginalis]